MGPLWTILSGVMVIVILFSITPIIENYLVLTRYVGIRFYKYRPFLLVLGEGEGPAS
jgi:hypothetical protein